MIGTTIGNYVVQKKIGQGGMGAVYVAEHPTIRRQVAIKVLLPEVSKNAEVVSRFFTEARSSSEIRNEHIIDILDFGQLPDGTYYLTMEWLEGSSLRDVLKKSGKVPLPRAIHIARQIARALAAAHARGIVHRDLKPDNVFLVRKNEDVDFVKVLDFGIAKLMAKTPLENEVKTQTGALIGTPAYMSPEQCRGQPVDQRTDLYALGVIVHQMLAGKLPFAADGLGELLLAHMTKTPPPLRSLDPSIPPAVEQAVLRALEKDQAKRFQSAEEFLAALGGESSAPYAIDASGKLSPYDPTLARPYNADTVGGAVGEAMPTTVSVKRRSWIFALAGVAVAAGVAGFVMLKQKPPEPAPLPAVAKPEPAPVPVPDPKPAQVPPAGMPLMSLVKIATTPPDAQVLLDGARVRNPFEGHFEKGYTAHRLVVKAPGFRTEEEWITFENDRDLKFALQKGSGTNVRGKPVSSKSEEGGKTIYKGTKGKLITDFPE